MAMSSDFFEMVLPNPVLSVAVVEAFTGFRAAESETCEPLRVSFKSTCPLTCAEPLPVGSMGLPRVTMGDECLLVVALTGLGISVFPLTVTATPGLDLPAETGLSGKLVLRFGGVS